MSLRCAPPPSPFRQLYEELAKVGDMDQQTMCLQQVEEMEPAIR